MVHRSLRPSPLHRDDKQTTFFQALVFAIVAALVGPLTAMGDDVYFVTYSHNMEERGSLEISPNLVMGVPKVSNRFLANWTELEYGVNGWWTSELYLDSQKTFHDSTVITGFRWENRFRPLADEHLINPVLYVEFEDISDADKALKEVVGFDSRNDLVSSNRVLQATRNHEMETKLILGTNHRGWNISENFIAEKNLAHEPWEFGYALGASRPLKLAAGSQECRWCRENLNAGLELYGGLGTWDRVTLHGTSHYAAPVVAWDLGKGVTVRLSPTFGLSPNSIPLLVRLGFSYEIPRFDRQVSRWFR